MGDELTDGLTEVTTDHN